MKYTTGSADLIIAYVERKEGGAYASVRRRKNKENRVLITQKGGNAYNEAFLLEILYKRLNKPFPKF